MYRSVSIVVLAVIAVSEGCAPPPCHWTDPTPIENYFKQVANVMIAADRKAQSFCSRYSTPNVKEFHKSKVYKIVYPSVKGDVYNIRVRGRVMFIDGDCRNSLVDVRVLPTYANGPGGSYAVEAGDLVITFPYRYDPLLGARMCMAPNSAIITLRPACSNDNKCNDNVY